VNKSALVFGFGLSLLSACPLLDVDVDVPEVCVTFRELAVEGGPVEGGPVEPGPQTIHQSFAVDDLSQFHAITDLDAQVAFVRGELMARSGITDFGFVQAARIAIRSGDDGSTLPPLTLYQCDGDCAAAGGTLAMQPDVQHDALVYLEGDSLIVDVDLTGELPQQDWTMSVDVCFAASVHYRY